MCMLPQNEVRIWNALDEEERKALHDVFLEGNTCASAATDLHDVSIAKHSHQHSSCINTLLSVLFCSVLFCSVLFVLVLSLLVLSSCQETTDHLAPIQALTFVLTRFVCCCAGIGSPSIGGCSKWLCIVLLAS